MSKIPESPPASSRPGANDEWATPRWLLDGLSREFCFVLDAAATDENALAPHYFTKDDDALSRDWTDGPWMTGVAR